MPQGQACIKVTFKVARLLVGPVLRAALVRDAARGPPRHVRLDDDGDLHGDDEPPGARRRQGRRGQRPPRVRRGVFQIHAHRVRPPAPPARARARRRRRRPIISDIQKIFPIFLPLLLWAWASNVYRVLRYGVTRERASGLVQMVLISARPSSFFLARTRNLRAPRAVVLIKFAIEELAPAKAALSDGLTHEEAVVLKEKTGTCLLYTSPSPRDATLSRMPSSA